MDDQTGDREYTVHKAVDLQNIVQTIRKDAKLSQADVAARLGVAAGSYSEFERNLPQGSVSRFLKLLKALDVEMVLSTKPATSNSGQQP